MKTEQVLVNSVKRRLVRLCMSFELSMWSSSAVIEKKKKNRIAVKVYTSILHVSIVNFIFLFYQRYLLNDMIITGNICVCVCF